MADTADPPRQSDLSYALPPDSVTDTLNTFSSANRDTQSAFNTLLRIPFLQDIKISSPGDRHARTGRTTSSDASAPTTLYPIITDAMGKHSAVQVIDVGIARQLMGFARTYPLIAKSMPRAQGATALSPMVAKYMQQANTKSVETKKFFSEFQVTIENTSATIDALDDDIEEIRKEIMSVELDIQAKKDAHEEGVLSRLKNRLGKYIPSSSDSEGSFFAALAAFFSITVAEVQAMIKNSDEISQLNRLLSSLQNFQSRVRNARLALTALMDSMTIFMRASVSIMSLWFEINMNLKGLAASPTPDEKFTDPEVAKIQTAWKTVQEAAEDFTESISDVGAQSVLSLSVANRQAISRSISLASAAVAAVPRATTTLTKEQQEAVKKLLPNDQVAKSLQAMSASSGKIVASFNKLLRVPFLDSLKVSDSAISGDNADGSGGEKDADVDLETLTVKYLQRYQKLQADTVPIARDLYGYALLQQRLLPMLGKQVSAETYVNANLPLIQARQKKAAEVHRLHNKFQQDWNLAINLVERAINEQKENIKGINAQIADLVKQKRNMTIGAVFAVIGAALFAAAAFATGGMLAVAFGAVGVGLVVGAGVMIAQAVKLNASINAFKSSLNTAQETLSQLEQVLPVMQEVATYLHDVTDIWNDISNNLTAIETNVQTWSYLIGPALGVLVDAAVGDWKKVSDGVLEYIAMVSNVNPEVNG